MKITPLEPVFTVAMRRPGGPFAPLGVKFFCWATARLQKFALIRYKTPRLPGILRLCIQVLILKIRTVGAQRGLSKSENNIFCIFSISKQAMRAKRLLLLPITNRPSAKAVSPIGIPTHFALRTPLLMRKIILFDPLISSQALQNTNPSPRWFRSHGRPGFPQYAGSRKSAG